MGKLFRDKIWLKRYGIQGLQVNKYEELIVYDLTEFSLFNIILYYYLTFVIVLLFDIGYYAI